MLQERAARLTLNIYGRRDRSRIAECVARVHKAPQRPLRVVAVEPLTGGRTVQAFYSTCPTDTAEAVLTRYSWLWSIEEMNQASKSHVGFEEPQGWTRRAVERTAPMAMLLYTWIVLSFADMLATLRQMSIQQEVSMLRLTGRGSRKIIKTLFNAFPRAA